MSSMDDLRFGDTTVLRWRAVDRQGRPFDLTNGSARLIIKERGKAEISKFMSVSEPTQGRVVVAQESTWPPGVYASKMEFILADGQKRTVKLSDPIVILGD